TAYPGDLMNPSLPPSQRRLPSAVDATILADARASASATLTIDPQGLVRIADMLPGDDSPQTDPGPADSTGSPPSVGSLPAARPTTALAPLFRPQADPPGITNGKFAVRAPADPQFGWTVRGSVSVSGGAALLRQDSHVFTGLTQTFTVPAGVTAL